MTTDPYATLGVTCEASNAEIKAAYRTLVRRHHPDVAGPGSARAFQEIFEAYQLLSDTVRRRAHDTAHQRPASGRTTGSSQQRGPHRGTGSAELTVDLADAIYGAVVPLRIRAATDVTWVRVPPGVEDGQQLKLAGKNPGGGDLVVRVRVREHPRFTRLRKHLTTTLALSVCEAALGADVRVDLLDGSSAVVNVPAGTTTGDVLHIAGGGVPGVRGTGGDLLLVVEVHVPRRLPRKARKALEAYRAAGLDNNPRDTT